MDGYCGTPYNYNLNIFKKYFKLWFLGLSYRAMLIRYVNMSKNLTLMTFFFWDNKILCKTNGVEKHLDKIKSHMNLFTFQFYGIYLVREATFDSALYFYDTDDKFIDITDIPYVLTMDIPFPIK